MNILMMTNTFTPHVGGVARSVQGFAREIRRKGHRVLVAAPLFKGAPEQEEDVIRFPAMQRFNGSEFSVPMPEPLRLVSTLRTFQPEVVHAHHPFLLGGTALRIAAARNLPLVFTHHTMYEKYTHYLRGNSPKLKRFVLDLVTGYCNLCDAIIAPSQTVADTLRERGVHTPITVIPTGVDTESFTREDGTEFREKFRIPQTAFVVGHVGRLAPEKNLEFLGLAVARFIQQTPNAYFLVVGAGPSWTTLQTIFDTAGLRQRLRMVGVLEAQELAAAYRSIDVFAFASHTETQGLVLTEAMAAGVPIVAVDAPGVKDIVQDGYNGRLIRRDDIGKFAQAIDWMAARTPDERNALGKAARVTAAELDMDLTADKAIALYASLRGKTLSSKRLRGTAWQSACRRLRTEWELLSNLLRAATDSIRPRMVWEVGAVVDREENVWEDEGIMETIESVADTARVEPLVETPKPDLKTRVVGWLWAWLLRFQYATWRKHYEGLDELDRLVAEGRHILFGFWHGKYVPLFALLRGRPCCVFTSQSARGAIIAEICRHFGYECVLVPVRGRSHPLDLMRRALARSQNGGIAVDGPFGPYHKVRRGAIKLAAELGYVIVPGSVSSERKRIIKHRWDRMEIPKIFTRVGFAIGKPLEIPPDLSPEETQYWVNRLHDELEALDGRSEELAGISTQHRP